jgi:serine/threonine protein kinase
VTNLATAAATSSSSETAHSLTEGGTIASSYILRRQMLAAGDDLIWLAHDEVLGKDVTLHFVPRALRRDAGALETLRQEIKRYRQLIHPQILRVYDLIEDGECTAIVMDAFRGTPLSVLLARSAGRKFEPTELRPWLAMLCRTLDDAHKIKLVHRDLSPVNIIIDEAGQLLVAKFGISRFIRDAIDRSTDRPVQDRHLAYASPQQLDGERPAVSDDVYGFGVLMFELLTGEPPFTGKDLPAQIHRKVPSSINVRRAALKKSGAPIPAAWEKAIAACLEKSATQRPADMREVAARLELEPAGANGVTTTTSRPIVSTELAPSALTTLSRASTAPSARQAAALQPGPAKVELRSFANSVTPSSSDTGNGKSGANGEGDGKAKVGAKFVKSDLEAAAVAARVEQKGMAPRKETVLITRPSPPVPVTSKKEEPVKAAPPSPERPPLRDDYPGFELRRGSNFPLTTLAAGAVLITIAVYGLFVFGPSTLESSPPRNFAPEDERALTEPIRATNASPADIAPDVGAVEPPAEPIRAANATFLVAAPPTEGQTAAPEEPAPASSERKPDASLATAKTSEAARANVADAARTTEPSANADATRSWQAQIQSLNENVAAKTAALENAQKEAQAAEKARQEMLKAKSDANAKMTEAEKAFEERTKIAAPTFKAAEEAAALQKAREEQMRAAEAAWQEAQAIAAEKARAAEEARKTFAAVEKETREKTALQEKAEAEIKELQNGLEAKRKIAADAAKAAAEAVARDEEVTAVVQRTEQELAAAKMAAQKAAEEAARIAAEKRRKIESEIAEAKAAFERKIAELENALKNAETGFPAPASSTPAAPAETNRSSSPAAPPETSTSSDAARSSVPPVGATSKKNGETLLAMKTEPGKTASPTKSAARGPLENSLGMKFVPVGDILFCAWQTRVKDFDTFARATGLKSKIWRDPGFRQGPDHPVVNVTWREAVAFCKWLTAKEQKEGTLSPTQEYRLPSDLEWSKAVGLPEESGKTPEARDMGVPDLYPWGTTWPPPKGAGNYTGEETGSDVAIKGYEDGFAWTAPVGSFAANKDGLYDMGGNVWQWCLDSWNAEHKDKVLRGASWYNGALRLSLLSSCRVHAAPDSSTDNYGFRCVIAPIDSGRSAKR